MKPPNEIQLQQQLAASQAENLRLRYALRSIKSMDDTPIRQLNIATEALHTPPGDMAALREVMAKVVDRCAKECEKEAVDVHNAPACIVARRCADSVRALQFLEALK